MQTPAVLNAQLAQRGVDAIVVPLHVTAEHLAVTVAGMRHLRNFAGYAVSIPHKPMAARLCDELMPTQCPGLRRGQCHPRGPGRPVDR